MTLISRQLASSTAKLAQDQRYFPYNSPRARSLNLPRSYELLSIFPPTIFFSLPLSLCLSSVYLSLSQSLSFFLPSFFLSTPIYNVYFLAHSGQAFFIIYLTFSRTGSTFLISFFQFALSCHLRLSNVTIHTIFSPFLWSASNSNKKLQFLN